LHLGYYTDKQSENYLKLFMKKLLVITPSFYPQIGGVERHVWETSNLIKKAGWQVSILTEQKPQAKKNSFSSR